MKELRGNMKKIFCWTAFGFLIGCASQPQTQKALDSSPQSLRAPAQEIIFDEIFADQPERAAKYNALSPAVWGLVGAYSEAGYRYLNRMLRRSFKYAPTGEKEVILFPMDPKDEYLKTFDPKRAKEIHLEYIRFAHQLQNVLNPIAHNFKVLYRGEGISLWHRKLQIFCEKYFKVSQPCQYRERAFLSTSEDREAALGFAGKGGVAFEIKDSISADVRYFSRSIHEAEVLFSPQTVFEVSPDSFQKTNASEGSYLQIHLKQVKDPSATSDSLIEDDKKHRDSMIKKYYRDPKSLAEAYLETLDIMKPENLQRKLTILDALLGNEE